MALGQDSRRWLGGGKVVSGWAPSAVLCRLRLPLLPPAPPSGMEGTQAASRGGKAGTEGGCGGGCWASACTVAWG